MLSIFGSYPNTHTAVGQFLRRPTFLALLAVCGLAAQVGAWNTVGNISGAEDVSASANQMVATRYTATTSFTAATMRMGMWRGAAGNLSMAIYADNGGSPNNLLGATASTPFSTGDGYVSVALTSGVAIVSGTTYWLCWNLSAGENVYMLASNSQQSMYLTRSFAQGWPSSYGTPTGNFTTGSTSIIALDSGVVLPVGPSGSIAIVDKNGYTNQASPTISVVYSSATQMQFSLTTQNTAATLYPVAASFSQLNISAGGQGRRVVWARFYDGTTYSPWVSDSTMYDTLPPTSAITTSGAYGGSNPAWNNISGTASDAAPGVIDSVKVSIQRRTGSQYWSGTAWVATQLWVKVAVTTSSWTAALSTTNLSDGVTYDVQSQAQDRAGNVQASVSSGTFSYDLSLAPTVSIPRTADTVAVNGTWTIAATVSPANATIAWYRETDTTNVLSSVATLTITNTQMADNGAGFFCKVTNTKGTARSNVVRLAVVTPVKAVFMAAPVTGPQGLTVTLTDASTGSIAQWVFSSGEKTPQVRTFTSKPTNLTFVYPDTGDFTLQLKVIGVSKAGRDSATQLIKITNKNGYNPLEVSAQYLSSTSVKVMVRHILDAGIVRNNPLSLYYADSIGLWYSRVKGGIDTSRTALRTAFAIAGKPDSFAVTLPVIAPAGSANTIYTFWACPLFRKGVDPYNSYSGADLYMRILNPLAASGRYVGAAATPANPVGIDSAEVFLDNAQSVEFAAAVSLTLSWKLRSAATASILTLTQTEFQALITGTRATWGWRSALVRGDTQLVDIAVTVDGKNGLKSTPVTTSFMVGLPQPVNPCALSVVGRTSGSITVSWNDPGVVDSVRIIYSTDRIPVGNLDALTTTIAQAVPAPTVADRQLCVTPLSKKTGYYLAIQVMRNLRWSKITTSGSVFVSTKDISPGDSVTNTVVVTSATYNTVKNTLDVGWSLDTIAGIPLSVGLTWGTDSTKAATQEPVVPGWGKIAAAPSPTGSTTLNPGPGLQAGSRYYVFLWLKSENGPFALPTFTSGTSVMVPDLQWSAVRYFPTPVVTGFGGDVVLRRDSTYTTTMEFSDTLRKFTPASLPDGFISVGTGFRFTQALNAEAFHVGIKYDSLPAGVTTGDLAIYRDSSGVLLVEWGSAYDPATDMVWVKTADLSDKSGSSMPFMLLADTRTPVITISAADTSDIAELGADLLDTLQVSDSNSKLRWQLQYSRDSDPFEAKNSVTGYACGSCPSEKVYLTIPALFITDNTGVWARVMVSDGPHTLTINISRRIMRTSSDAVVTMEKSWVPLSTTAVLDSPSVKQALRGLSEEGKPWTYDNTQFRLFRWNPAPGSNSVDNKNWVEYSETRAELFSMVPGRVVWAKTAQNRRINLGRGATPSLKDMRGITLPARQFTDFALPLRLDVCVGDMRAASGASADSVEIYEWVKNKATTYVSQLRYSLLVPGMQRSDYVVASNALVAYTALNLSSRDVVLQIPPISVSTSTYAVALSKGMASQDAQGWSIKIAANTGDGQPLSSLYCGYSPGDLPTTYLPSPPSFGSVSVGAYDRANNKVYGNTIIHRSMGNGCAWEVAFCNGSDEAQTVVYELRGVGAIPEGFDLRVVEGLGKRFAQSVGSYEVTVPAHGRVFRQIVAGTTAYLDQYVGNLPSDRLALIGCYPNPFRGAMQVRFSLPALSDIGRVSLTLFDVQGRRLWSLSVTHNLRVGVNQIWVDPSPRGNALPSGMFVMRMDVSDSKGSRVGSFKTRVLRAR